MAHKSFTKRKNGLPEYRLNEFCYLYGDSIRNQILCYFLECYGSDEPLASVIDITGISKPAVYKQIKELVKQGIIVPTRKFRNMQLYSLNVNNPKVLILKKQFDIALNSVFTKHNSKITENNNELSVESIIKEMAKKNKLDKSELKELASAVLQAL